MSTPPKYHYRKDGWLNAESNFLVQKYATVYNRVLAAKLGRTTAAIELRYKQLNDKNQTVLFPHLREFTDFTQDDLTFVGKYEHWPVEDLRLALNCTPEALRIICEQPTLRAEFAKELPRETRPKLKDTYKSNTVEVSPERPAAPVTTETPTSTAVNYVQAESPFPKPEPMTYTFGGWPAEMRVTVDHRFVFPGWIKKLIKKLLG